MGVINNVKNKSDFNDEKAKRDELGDSKHNDQEEKSISI